MLGSHAGEPCSIPGRDKSEEYFPLPVTCDSEIPKFFIVLRIRTSGISHELRILVLPTLSYRSSFMSSAEVKKKKSFQET